MMVNLSPTLSLVLACQLGVYTLVTAIACRGGEVRAPDPDDYIIAFSSCLQQFSDTSIWNRIAEQKPKLFLFMGDTIYADTHDMGVKRRAFARLNADPNYIAFKKSARVLAMWDDHDYGLNDIGGNYAEKKQMQKIFLDAFDEPKDSLRRTQEGIYTAEEMTIGGKIIQIIVVDVRYFRTNWTYGPKIPPYSRTYVDDNRETSTVLGEAQWQWLSMLIARKADLRLFVTSTPVLSDDYKGERWGAFPRERARLFREMASAQTGKWVIITGDRHFAQVSHRDDVLPYPLVELMASGMNTVWYDGSQEPDRYRDGETLPDYNFGVLRIHGRKGSLRYALHNGAGEEWKRGEIRF